MKKYLFLVPYIWKGVKYLVKYTKTKRDDRVVNAVNNLVTRSPEILSDAEDILKYGEEGYEDLKEAYKKDKSKTKTAKKLYVLVSTAPHDKIKKVISSAKKELKKNERK